jgi:hypothetical protein
VSESKAASNVIAFRPRKATAQELVVYRDLTKLWSDQMKQLVLPNYYEAEAETSKPPTKG